MSELDIKIICGAIRRDSKHNRYIINDTMKNMKTSRRGMARRRKRGGEKLLGDGERGKLRCTYKRNRKKK